ncbi:cytochrome P450 [Thelephora ganbajun]|uniref:Cytochrome P450 n=1 Tax=Thelephora ganbajun TaxID=370292 RepID=A0ACB6ZPA7_THEGA|nr:cytochrome P450 [Thelephora ganbajun]
MTPHIGRRVLALRFIREIILAPTVIGFTIYYLAWQFGLTYKPLLVVGGVIVGWPIKFSLRVRYESWRRTRRASEIGAVTASESRGKLFGDIDVVQEVQEIDKNGFVGEWFATQHERVGSGTFSGVLMGEYFMTTSDPGNIKVILATEFNNFEKGSFHRESMASVFGEGVFNTDGELWKMHRSMTRPFFTKDRIKDFETLDKYAMEAIDKMKRRFSEGYALNFEDLIHRFTLDAACEFLFETTLRALDSELAYPHTQSNSSGQIPNRKVTREEAFSQALIDAETVLSNRLLIGESWPLLEFFKDKSEPYMEVINEFLNPVLEEGLAKHAAQTKAGPTDKEATTLLGSLLSKTTDRDILRDETLNILIAGRDTTASTLTFMVFLLSLHPEVFERLRAEVLEVVGPTERPTYENIREMKYLRAVLNETLRIYPPAPFNVRTSINETTLPEGGKDGKPIYVPAQTFISFSPIIMHRRKDLWGPDADEFDPDRFIDDRMKKYFVPNPFIFLPFNTGPRICLGQQFAYNEMSFFMIRLLQNFDNVTLDMDAQPQRTTSLSEWKTKKREVERDLLAVHLTLSTKDGIWVRMNEVSVPE